VRIVKRREALAALAAAAAGTGAALDWTPAQLQHASRLASRGPGQAFTPKFFTAHEWASIRALVDLIIPRDARSGGATDAGVPEFMDFLLAEGNREQQTWMRGGLAWLDIECRERFSKSFVECTDAERRSLLDQIAWPARAPAELSHGVAFFNRVRDLTASGFWSSKMGVEDLRYMGNTGVADWTGCPEPQLRKLGVRYE
jgi:hypothetical protein